MPTASPRYRRSPSVEPRPDGSGDQPRRPVARVAPPAATRRQRAGRHRRHRPRRGSRGRVNRATTRGVVDQATRRAKRLSLELKYAAIAVAMLGLFVLVPLGRRLLRRQQHAERGVNRPPASAAIGMFLIALIANLSIIIQIPYTLPLLSAALGGAEPPDIMLSGSHRAWVRASARSRATRSPTRIVGKSQRCPTAGCSVGSPATSTIGRGRRSG